MRDKKTLHPLSLKPCNSTWLRSDGQAISLLESFRLLPEAIHFRQACLLQRAPLFCQAGFNKTEALLEFGVGPAQGRLRVNPGKAGEIDASKQEIAYLLRQTRCFIGECLTHLL